MNRESLVYAINLAIGAILSALLLRHWRRADRDPVLGTWALAAVTMTAADVLFAVRPAMPWWAGRFFPTLLVTLGQAVLLIGAERATGRARHLRSMAVVVAAHAAALAAMLALDLSSWRPVLSGLVWGGLSIAAFVTLRRSSSALRGSFAIPAFVFLAHGLFHAGRIVGAAVLASQGAESATGMVQVLGDVEVSLYMVALFASMLLAHLELRNEALQAALADVHQLSGLLPVCAWCHRVRNDDGYWTQLEQYLRARSRMQFTHGICEECVRDHLEKDLPPGTDRSPEPVTG